MPANPEQESAVVVPPGMVPWKGGDTAPDDWDGGVFLTRCGARMDGRIGGEPFWDHSFGAGDVIAYTPRTPPAPSQEQPASGSVESVCEQSVNLVNETGQQGATNTAADPNQNAIGARHG